MVFSAASTFTCTCFGFKITRMEEIRLKAPDFSTLRLHYVTVDQESVEKASNSNKHLLNSPHALQHETARELIDRHSNIILCPTQNLHQLMVIAPTTFTTDDADWPISMQRFHLKLIGTKNVDAQSFGECLRFTIVNRMAPEWNRVGDCLVQGTCFLDNMLKKRYRSVELHVRVVCSDWIILSVDAAVLRMSPLEHWQLDVMPPQTETTKNGNQSTVRRLYEGRSAVMLPKLSRGRVMAMRADLPSHSTFDNYGQLREYWMLSYGYSLPATPPEFYYDVGFFGSSTNLFTYPSYCVLCAKPDRQINVDVKELNLIGYAFSQLLGRKLPSICGIDVQMERVKTTYTNIGHVNMPLSPMVLNRSNASRTTASPRPSPQNRKTARTDSTASMKITQFCVSTNSSPSPSPAVVMSPIASVPVQDQHQYHTPNRASVADQQQQDVQSPSLSLAPSTPDYQGGLPDVTNTFKVPTEPVNKKWKKMKTPEPPPKENRFVPPKKFQPPITDFASVTKR